MAEDPYSTLEDGTPKDPKAYQAAIRADAEKMDMLDEDPEAKAVVLGDDMHAFQELIRGAYQVTLHSLIPNDSQCNWAQRLSLTRSSSQK